MSVILERNWSLEITKEAEQINHNLSGIQAIEPYEVNSIFFIKKELESSARESAIKKELDELKRPRPEITRIKVSHSRDSSLILDAITLSNDFDSDWKNIITATPNPLEVEEYIELENKKKNYPVSDMAYDFDDVITQIIEVGYQKQEVFGDYKRLHNEINAFCDKKEFGKAKQVLRQLQRRLKRCLPAEEEMIEQTTRTPHLTGTPHLNE